ncbi:MAG: type III-A CRISPR-associated RAMP protein Csm4, partial [Chloroflexota bacterium]
PSTMTSRLPVSGETPALRPDTRAPSGDATQFLLYRLEARGPLHLGERGVGVEETGVLAHADTLFSAICSALRQVRGTAALEELLSQLHDPASAPFRLGSAHPYYGEITLFPRPRLPARLADAPDTAKRLKHVRFVSRAVFADWVAGHDLTPHLHPECFLQHDAVWVSEAEATELPSGGLLWAEQAAPRVTIDRLSGRSEVWNLGRLWLAPGGGLAFLAQVADAPSQVLLQTGLEALAESGLGGRRSSGHGQFRLLPPERLFWNNNGANGLVTLAPYAPTLAELERGALAPPASYDLLDRFGWIGSPEGRSFRRRSVRMIAEGAALPEWLADGGQLVDVTPAAFTAHRVYRAGLVLGLPARLPEVTNA